MDSKVVVVVVVVVDNVILGLWRARSLRVIFRSFSAEASV